MTAGGGAIVCGKTSAMVAGRGVLWGLVTTGRAFTGVILSPKLKVELSVMNYTSMFILMRGH